MTELHVSVSNVGGIDELECTFDEALNVVTGPNASNKTSLLKAIAFGLGRSTTPIKSGAEEACVELEVGGERVVRTARVTSNGLEVAGERLLESSDEIELLEQFACLFEFNTVRQAVRRDDDFEDVLKAPMNLDELERERTEKLERKRDLQKDVERLDDVAGELDAKNEALTEARERVEALQARLDDLRDRQLDISTGDDDLSDVQTERAGLVRKRDEYENQVADIEASVERLDERIVEVDDAIAEAREDSNQHDVDRLRAERAEIEGDLRDIRDRIEVLQSVLTANREMLSDPYAGILGRDTGLMEDVMNCWACGNEAPESDFEETLERVRALVERDKARRRERDPRLRELREELDTADRIQRRIAELEEEKHDLEEQRESRRDSLTTRREQLSNVRDELAELDEKLAAREAEQQFEASDITDEVERLRDDLHDARRDVARLQSEIEDLRADCEQRRRKQDLVDELSEEIVQLTERIEHLEEQLRVEFNEAMEELLSILAYQNVNRMWLDGNFDLVVSREIDGVTRRDTLENLSESEREMVGLVLALAGYVTYDVSEIVPVLLIDTLGAFDADQTADLLEYFAGEVPLLVASLLPESADAVDRLDVGYDTVHPGGTILR